MRLASDLRLALTEEDFTAVSIAAFRAGKPLHQWLKDQILVGIQQQPEAPAQQPKPAEAVPALEPPPPQSVADRLVSVRADVHAHAPEPPAPAPPAPEPPAAATPAPVLAKSPSVGPPNRGPNAMLGSAAIDALVPKGFEAVVSMGEKIVSGQAQARRIAKASKGVRYNRLMGDFYEKEGIGNLPSGIRFQISKVGERAAELRRWYNLVPPGTVPPDVRPFALLRIFEQNPVPRQSATKGQSTLVFSRNSIRNVPVEEVMTKPGEQPAAAPMEPAKPPELPKFDSFAQVEFNKLPEQYRRALRRFSEAIFNVGGPRDLAQNDVALAIRKIRGKDTSDTPQIARDLVRLGVISGGSGDYRLRREYTDRFTEVVMWGKTPEEVA